MIHDCNLSDGVVGDRWNSGIFWPASPAYLLTSRSITHTHTHNMALQEAFGLAF